MDASRVMISDGGYENPSRMPSHQCRITPFFTKGDPWENLCMDGIGALGSTGWVHLDSYESWTNQL